MCCHTKGQGKMKAELLDRYAAARVKFDELAGYLQKDVSPLEFDKFDEFCVSSREYERSIYALFNDTASYLFDLTERDVP